MTCSDVQVLAQGGNLLETMLQEDESSRERIALGEV